jgi:ribosomal protein S18 acetylase RimI-like enzyme
MLNLCAIPRPTFCGRDDPFADRVKRRLGAARRLANAACILKLRPMAAPDIRPLSLDPATVDQLAEMLVEVVAAGGSVSFMHPLAPETARAFWTKSLAAADAGERVVLGAVADGRVVSTVTLLLDCPPNQPHRGEIAKMMTRLAFRGRGLAAALLAEAERIAAARGRTLLTLDTAEEDGASGLYERLGYQFCGLIPDYAFKPHGGLTGTKLYFKRIGDGAEVNTG